MKHIMDINNKIVHYLSNIITAVNHIKKAVSIYKLVGRAFGSE